MSASEFFFSKVESFTTQETDVISLDANTTYSGNQDIATSGSGVTTLEPETTKTGYLTSEAPATQSRTELNDTTLRYTVNTTHQLRFSGDDKIATSSDTTIQLTPEGSSDTTDDIYTPRQPTNTGNDEVVTFPNMTTNPSLETTTNPSVNKVSSGAPTTELNIVTSHQTTTSGDDKTISSSDVVTNLDSNLTTFTKELSPGTTKANIDGSIATSKATYIETSTIPTSLQSTTATDATNSVHNDTISISNIPTHFNPDIFTDTKFFVSTHPMTANTFLYSNPTTDITSSGSFLSSTAQLILWIGVPTTFVIGIVIFLALYCRKKKMKKLRLKKVRDLWFVKPELDVETIRMETLDQTRHLASDQEKTNSSVDVTEPLTVNVFAMDNEGYTKSPKRHRSRHSTTTSMSSKGLRHSFKSTSSDAASMFKSSKMKKPHSQVGSPSIMRNMFEDNKQIGSNLDETTDFPEDDNSSTTSVFTDNLSPKMGTFMAIQKSPKKAMPTVSISLSTEKNGAEKIMTTSDKTPHSATQTPVSAKVTPDKQADVTNLSELSTKKQFLY